MHSMRRHGDYVCESSFRPTWVGALTLLVSLATTTLCGGGERLRVLTYNIHHGEGEDRKLDLERIAAVIRDARPDVVSLQEVDRRVQRTRGVDQPTELARLAQLHVAFGANIKLQGGEYGNAVLSRLPLTRHQNRPLPCLKNGEQRGVLEVEMAWPDERSRLVLLATHFDHRPDDAERRASAEFVNQRARELEESTPGVRVMLAGDLNDHPASATLQRLREAGWTTNDGELPTIPVDAPKRQIDFILVRPSTAWRIVETQVLPEAIASDHRAVLMVLESAP